MFQIKDPIGGDLKYVAISRAVVLDNADPLKRGRIRVNSPVLGETGWIPYLTAPGMFSVPEPKDVVYIQCDGGFYTHPVAWGNFTRGLDNDVQIPEEFQRINPSNRGIYSPGGHIIEIDDGSDLDKSDKGFRITTSGGNMIHIAEDPQNINGKITIETAGGLIVTVDGTLDNASIETAGGANFIIDGLTDKVTSKVAFGDNLELSAANGFQVNTPAAGGTTLSQKGGKIDLTATLDSTFTVGNGALTLEASNDVSVISDTGSVNIGASAGDVEATASGDAKLKLSGGKVGLGGPAGELLEEVSKLADELSKLALEDSTHVHPTAVGPSGPPTNAANMIAINAAATAIKTIIDLIKGGI